MDAGTGGWNVFTPYGGLHLITVLACVAAIAALVLIGRRLAPAGEQRLRRGLAVIAFTVWTLYNIAWNWNGLDLVSGLPLQVCDLGELIAPLALMTRMRVLRATLYFWAFALTTQAFIQPTVTQGPASILFWCFWIAHTIILACAVYDLAVLNFRPGWSDLRRAVLFSLAYLAGVFVLDVILGSNYGYVGDPADKTLIPPFVHMLGPWPARVGVMATLAGLGFVLVLLPWRLRPRPFPDAQAAV